MEVTVFSSRGTVMRSTNAVCNDFGVHNKKYENQCTKISWGKIFKANLSIKILVY